MPESSDAPARPLPQIHRATVHQHDENVTIAVRNNVILFVGRGLVTIQSLECTMRVRGELTAAYPDGLSLLVLAHGMPALPSADVQKYAVTKLPRANPALKSIALITPQKGFWVSALRSMLTPLFRTRSDFMRISMFSAVQAAAEWTATQLAGPPQLQGNIERTIGEMLELPLPE